MPEWSFEHCGAGTHDLFERSHDLNPLIDAVVIADVIEVQHRRFDANGGDRSVGSPHRESGRGSIGCERCHLDREPPLPSAADDLVDGRSLLPADGRSSRPAAILMEPVARKERKN